MSPPSRTLVAPALAAVVVACWLLPPLLRGRADPTELALWQTLVVQLAWCALAGALAVSLGGAVRERLGLVRGGLSAASAALAVLGTLALSGALQFAVQELALTAGSSLARLDAIASGAAERHPGLLLLAFGLAPGFGEELLFRGAIQRSLGRGLGAWAVPSAALGFAAIHLDPVHSPAAFVLGCYLGALAHLRQTTWIAIASHVANNCAATLSQLGAGSPLPAPGSWLGAGLWLAAAGLALALVARGARPAASDATPSG